MSTHKSGRASVKLLELDINHGAGYHLKSCYVCQRAKSSRSGKHGLLRPLPSPESNWTEIGIDFITPLPVSIQFGSEQVLLQQVLSETHVLGTQMNHTVHPRSFQYMMVVVDRLPKKRKFIALDSLDVESVIQAFIRSMSLLGNVNMRAHPRHHRPR